MAVVYALILAVVGALFVYLALQVEGGFSLTSLNLAAYYVTVAFIAFVNMILFAARRFREGIAPTWIQTLGFDPRFETKRFGSAIALSAGGAAAFWPTRPGATGSGWHDGSSLAGSRCMSFIRPVSRSRANAKRAKTDRLDAAMLMRVFLGWLRGERGHCGMVAVPTLEEEDARRPSRERESLVNEKSRITNRMKGALARLGIRGFKAHLRKAALRLEGLRTPEGTGLPPNITEEFRRDMARLALVREQIAAIEKARIERLQRAPNTGPNLMVRLLARVIGISIETADMLVREILSRNWRDRRAVARYAGLTGSPDESGTKRREKGSPKRAMPGCAVA